MRILFEVFMADDTVHCDVIYFQFNDLACVRLIKEIVSLYDIIALNRLKY
jgi:hypothetical protein